MSLRERNEEPVREYLVFRLAEDTYGVELIRVQEIVNPPALTEVPRANATTIGICSVRGMLVTVVDLRRVLRLAEAPASRNSRILLTRTEGAELMGLYVDEVFQVSRLLESEIEGANAVLGADLSDHVAGIGRPDGELIVLLDMSSITS